MSRTFEDKVVLITGAGSGIGRATALAMAGLGATVAVNDLRDERVQAVVDEIRSSGQAAFPVAVSVATRDGMRQAVARTRDAGGRLDVLVNNAAWVRYQPLAEITPEATDRMLDIGFKAVVWGLQAAAEAMDGQRGGAIVNIASITGLRAPPNAIVYSGIKAGVMGMTRAAAAELGGRGIRVNAVAPSAIPTEGTEKFRRADRDAAIIARTPLGRLGTVDDIARAICFLACDDSGFITAQTLTVDGGILLCDA